MYFGCFQNMSIKVTPNFEKYGKCLKIFANTNSKCTCIREILPYVRGMKVLLGPCIHRKLYISSRVTPCTTNPDCLNTFNALFSQNNVTGIYPTETETVYPGPGPGHGLRDDLPRSVADEEDPPGGVCSAGQCSTRNISVTSEYLC